jgi:hypothetical protein
VDLIIKNNIFRRVYGHPTDPNGDYCHPGIWLDWANQGCRITGNFFYDIYGSNRHGDIFIEANHGPTVVDNNVFIHRDPSANNRIMIETCSRGNVIVHNLFFSGTFYFYGDPRSGINWYVPHTTTNAGSGNVVPGNERYMNNLVIGSSFGPLPIYGPNYLSNYNAFCQNSTKTAKTEWDVNSVTNNSFQTGLTLQEAANGVQIHFSMDATLLGVQCPVINKALFGIFDPTTQGIENPDGSGITIEKDMLGNTRSSTHPKVGPFETITSGQNQFLFTAGPVSSSPTKAVPAKSENHGYSLRSNLTKNSSCKLFTMRGEMIKNANTPHNRLFIAVFNAKAACVLSEALLEKSSRISVR